MSKYFIETRNFDSTKFLFNPLEVKALETFYDCEGLINEVVSLMADYFTPSDEETVWGDVGTLRAYIERAIHEGLSPIYGDSEPNLTDIFKSGYYLYFVDIAYEQLSTLSYNYMAIKVNNAVQSILKDDSEFVYNVHEARHIIAYEALNVVPSTHLSELDGIVSKIIGMISNGNLKIDIR